MAGKGGLLGAIEAAATPKGPVCSVKRLLERLDPADRKDLVAAMAREDIESTKIARVLQAERGERIAGGTIRRHRKGECSCGRAG